MIFWYLDPWGRKPPVDSRARNTLVSRQSPGACPVETLIDPFKRGPNPYRSLVTEPFNRDPNP